MTGSCNSTKQRWLESFYSIQALVPDILEALQGNDDADTERLNTLIKEHDCKIRQLPFSELNETDVSDLMSEIELLKRTHQQITDAVTDKRQQLLNQSGQSKKASRSINAYRQTQDI